MKERLTRRYECKYSMVFYVGYWRQIWELFGRDGAIDLVITDEAQDGRAEEFVGAHYEAVMMIHWRTSPGHMAAQPPVACSVTRQPCWHEPASRSVGDSFLPLYGGAEMSIDEHERMFRALIKEADRIFGTGFTATPGEAQNELR